MSRLACVLLALAASGCATGAPAGPMITAIAVRPDGRMAVGGDDGIVRLCSEYGDEEARLLVGSAVTRVAYAPDGNTLAVAYRSQVRLCRSQDGVSVGSLDVAREVRDLAFSPCGATLVTADASEVRLWDARPGTGAPLLATIEEPGVSHLATAVREGREVLATASEVGVIRFWDLRTRELLLFRNGPGGAPGYGLPCGRAPSGLALSPDAGAVAFAVVRDFQNGPWQPPGPRTLLNLTAVTLDGTRPGGHWSAGWGGEETRGAVVQGLSAIAFLPDQDEWVWITQEGWDHQPREGSHGCMMVWPPTGVTAPTTALGAAGNRVVSGGPAGALRLHRLGTNGPWPEHVWEKTLAP